MAVYSHAIADLTTMKTLRYAILAILTLASTAFAARPTELYNAGDVVEFRIERGGKVFGTQKATCAGLNTDEGDSLLVFNMETKTVVDRSGRSFDMDVNCEVAYRTNGLPRDYKFELTLLNAKVTHAGRFTGREYVGTGSRLGVTQPFNFPLERWPILFDNNFALQWEIAAQSVRRNPGDSMMVEAMIPQMNQLMVFSVKALPFESIEYAGQSVRTRVLQVSPANQILYLDDTGRLLKAVDKVSGISVIRQAPGESAEIVRQSIWTMIYNRLTGYLILTAMALGWFVALGYSGVKLPQTWATLIIAAGLYWLSLQVLMPIQNAYFGWAIDPRSGSGNTYIMLFGSALIFAIVELAAIALPIVAFHLIKRFDSIKIAIAVGIAAGAGFGLMQAANLTQFGADGSILLPVDMLQKVALIGVCAVCGGLIGLFVTTGRTFPYYLIPIGIKALLNWTSVFVQKGDLTLPPHTFISILIAASCVYMLFVFRNKLSRYVVSRKQIKTN